MYTSVNMSVLLDTVKATCVLLSGYVCDPRVLVAVLEHVCWDWSAVGVCTAVRTCLWYWTGAGS